MRARGHARNCPAVRQHEPVRGKERVDIRTRHDHPEVRPLGKVSDDHPDERTIGVEDWRAARALGHARPDHQNGITGRGHIIADEYAATEHGCAWLLGKNAEPEPKSRLADI